MANAQIRELLIIELAQQPSGSSPTPMAQTHSDEIVLVKFIECINCTYLRLYLLYGPM